MKQHLPTSKRTAVVPFSCAGCAGLAWPSPSCNQLLSEDTEAETGASLYEWTIGAVGASLRWRIGCGLSMVHRFDAGSRSCASPAMWTGFSPWMHLMLQEGFEGKISHVMWIVTPTGCTAEEQQASVLCAGRVPGYDDTRLGNVRCSAEDGRQASMNGIDLLFVAPLDAECECLKHPAWQLLSRCMQSLEC